MLPRKTIERIAATNRKSLPPEIFKFLDEKNDVAETVAEKRVDEAPLSLKEIFLSRTLAPRCANMSFQWFRHPPCILCC